MKVGNLPPERLVSLWRYYYKKEESEWHPLFLA
jgi:hypothetical protein